MSECKHETMGHRMIGGFPGHEHTHPVGPQVCLECGRTLEEIIKMAVAEHNDSIDKLYCEIFAWSETQFGVDRGPVPSLHHLRKEIVNELLNGDPYDLKEYADATMLIYDACAKAGHSFAQLHRAVREKLEINRKRKWGSPNAEGFAEHVEERG